MKDFLHIARDVFAIFGFCAFLTIVHWLFRVKPKFEKARQLLDLASREQKLWLKYLITDPEKAQLHREGYVEAWDTYNQLMASIEGKK